jgi:hypothetical protein
MTKLRMGYSYTAGAHGGFDVVERANGREQERFPGLPKYSEVVSLVRARCRRHAKEMIQAGGFKSRTAAISRPLGGPAPTP